MLEFEVIAHADTPLGVFILRRRTEPVEGVIELTLETQFLMSSVVTDSERALATRAIALHKGTNLDVLIGGLGLGYTAQAALASPNVAHVDVIEFVQGIIDWVSTGLIPIGKELTADPRFHAVHDDLFARLRKAPTKKYDVLIIDVDHSPDDRLGQPSDSFYAHDTLKLVAEHLKPGGVFGLWSTSDSPAFEDELDKTFEKVRIETISFVNETTGHEETNWLFFAKNPRPAG